MAREMERGTARRVTGHEDDPRRTRQVERGAVAVCRDFADPRDAQQPVGGREHQELQERRDLDRAEPLGRVRDLATGECRIELVDEDRRRALAADPLGEADVVGVAVGKHHRPDVVERAAHGGQFAREIAPVRGRAGVDDRHLAVRLDQVRIDEAPS